MKLFKNKKGFTLLELLIVLTIIGVIAGLMFPVMAAQVERSRAQEAITALGTLKEGLVRYHQTVGAAANGGVGTYVGANFANIGYNPNNNAAGQVPLFSYVIDAATLAQDVFLITAQREPAAANGGNTVTINQAGVVTRNGVYA